MFICTEVTNQHETHPSTKVHKRSSSLEDMVMSEDNVQDSEVATILQNPKTRRKIIIKRGSVKVRGAPLFP
jgi:hypothetical protein